MIAKTKTALFASGALVLLTALTASAQPAAQTGDQPVLIRHGKLITLGKDGTIPDGDVLIDHGKIAAVGPNLPAPANAIIIDAHGKPVTPGLMITGSQLGIEEVSAVAESNDGQGDPLIATAAFDVADAVNPNSTLLPVARVAGVTRSLTVPGGGESVFLGQGAVIDLGTSTNIIDKPGAVMLANLAGGRGGREGHTRPVQWIEFREILSEAREYWANKSAWGRPGAARDQRAARVDLEALGPVIKGEMPVLVEANRASDIRQVIAYAQSAHLKVVIEGASEGWMVAGDLAKANIPVVIDTQHNLPVSFAAIGATLMNASRLDKAGVTVVFMPQSGGSAHFAKNITQMAGDAVAYGMPWEHALAAITKNPAQVWGISASYGTLETGKDGDVVVWDGDPLEVTSAPKTVLIKGVLMPNVTRQTELRDRYRDIAKKTGKPFGYQ